MSDDLPKIYYDSACIVRHIAETEGFDSGFMWSYTTALRGPDAGSSDQKLLVTAIIRGYSRRALGTGELAILLYSEDDDGVLAKDIVSANVHYLLHSYEALWVVVDYIATKYPGDPIVDDFKSLPIHMSGILFVGDSNQIDAAKNYVRTLRSIVARMEVDVV